MRCPSPFARRGIKGRGKTLNYKRFNILVSSFPLYLNSLYILLPTGLKKFLSYLFIMKRTLFCFISLLVLTSSLCFGQDTIVYRSGDRIVVKVLSVGKKIEITDSSGKIYRIYKEYVAEINYANGTKLVVNKQEITIEPMRKDTVDEYNHMPININAGIGVSLISLEIPGSSRSGGPDILTSTPAYNCIMDYKFLRWLSIGVGWSYQSITDHPATEYGNGTFNYANWELEKISRYQVSGIMAFHFSKGQYRDAYAGFRLGQSVWSEQILYNNMAGIDPWTTFNQHDITTSYQVFFGDRIFFFKNLGFHIEVGIGSPFLLEGGLTFRFKTRKPK